MFGNGKYIHPSHKTCLFTTLPSSTREGALLPVVITSRVLLLIMCTCHVPHPATFNFGAIQAVGWWEWQLGSLEMQTISHHTAVTFWTAFHMKPWHPHHLKRNDKIAHLQHPTHPFSMSSFPSKIQLVDYLTVGRSIASRKFAQLLCLLDFPCENVQFVFKWFIISYRINRSFC